MSAQLAQEPAVGIEPTTARFHIQTGDAGPARTAEAASKSKARSGGIRLGADTRTAIKRPTDAVQIALLTLAAHAGRGRA